MQTMSEQPRYWSLYLVGFANWFGLITITTLLPTYIDLLNPSGIAIGLFVTGLTFAQAIADVPYGWAGDKFDKRALLLGALGVCAVAYAVFPLVDSSAGFIAARFLQGLGVVGVSLLSLTLVGEMADANERANAIGKYNAWKLAAGVVGTLGAGALYDRYGFGTVFGLLVVLFLAALVGAWRFTRPDRTSVGFAFGSLALNRRILTLTSFRVPYAFGVTLVRNWVPIYVGVSAARGGLGLAAFVVGFVIATERLTNMALQPFTGRLSDRYGRELFVLLGGGLYGVVTLAVPLAPAVGGALGLPDALPVLGTLTSGFLVVLAANALLGVADSFREPASMALFADEGTDQGGVTSSFGIRSLVWRPGSVVAPMVGGVVMTQVGIEWVFYLAGAVVLSGVLTFFGVLSYTRGRRALARS